MDHLCLEPVPLFTGMQDGSIYASKGCGVEGKGRKGHLTPVLLHSQWIHTAFWTAKSWFHLRLQAIRYIAAYKFIVGTALNLVFTFTGSAYAS